MNERQREPGNAILPAECSLMEETAAFEALFPCGRTVRDSFDGLRIALCTEGAIRIEVDGIGHELERGQLLCLTPSRRIRVESHTAELRLRMLSFSFDFLAGQPFLLRASVREAMEQSPCIAPDRQAWRSLSELFDFLRMQLSRDGFPSRREVVEALLFVLVAETSHLYADRPLRRRGARCEQIADGFFALLHRNFRQQHSPKFYAAELCITEKYLIRAISRATEHTPGYWIANFRLREANVLLRSTDLSVTEIAELLGFGSPSLFARFFRRMTGSAPLSVRRTGRKGE